MRILACLILIICITVLPSVRAQSVTIGSMDYPATTTATDVGTIDVRVHLSYTGLSRSGHLLVILFDTDRMNSNSYSPIATTIMGTFDATPYNCKMTIPDYQGHAICRVEPTDSSGSSDVTFHLTERKNGVWKLTVSVGMYDGQNSKSVAYSSQNISISVTYVPLWAIAIPAIAVTIVVAVILFQRRKRQPHSPAFPTIPPEQGAVIQMQQPQHLFCINCGNELRSYVKFCNKCGTKQP